MLLYTPFFYPHLQIRPELNQYIVESDIEGRPFNRLQRARAYQRAKNVNDTLPFGTRRDLYDVHTEWINHSMYPKEVDPTTARHVIGVSAFGTTQPYSSSILNISAMSHGAISANAIKALNGGAKLGHFSHNTGEGGVSKYHMDGGGDLVWNIGTGYFGCGSGSSKRTFEPSLFQETLQDARGQVKMIEIKLSQVRCSV
jgi:glutamate synthase domain-containing protein 2